MLFCKKAELGVKEKVVEGNKKPHNNQDNCDKKTRKSPSSCLACVPLPCPCPTHFEESDGQISLPVTSPGWWVMDT